MSTIVAPSQRLCLTRPAIGSATLSTVTALYLLLLSNQTFWSKGFADMADQPLATGMLALGLAAIFIAACVTVSVKYATKPLFIGLILASAAGSWFMDHFGIIIDVEMIRNAAETTPAEAGHLMTPAFLLHMALYGVLPSVLISLVRIVHRPFLQKVKWNLAVILPCLIVFVAAGLSHASTYASVTREHRDWFATLNPFMPIASAVRYAIHRDAERNIVVQPLGRDAHVAGLPAGSRKPRLTIIVAGETARAENFSLNGYGRLTNPELAKRDITYFTDTRSCGTATAVSLPCMFSVYPKAAYSHAKGLDTENLLDVLTHAGIKAEWWDNNTGSKQIANRVAQQSMPDTKDPRFCKDGECEDGVLLDRLDAWMDKVDQDTVLVLHQIGSHGPAYYQRYPESFRTFTPDCRTAEFADCLQSEIVNAYDNTILYTDHVLATIIDKLAARQDRLSPAMIYMSDHGESLGEFGLYLHGAPYMIAPSQQTHVPFVLWQGQEEKRDMDQACLQAEAVKPTSHDNLFHTVLGMMHVETSVRDRALDLVSACRTAAAS
ncbi:phosphoethanolamine transferase [Agrobacterium sp. a22-2]|uniref:phosphoethanolamine transferase n=1 Tax=Agrobacterium sp. a22-2 TaxID=2283840 RepID=UPI0034CD0B66